jgi:hypothetical protein
MVSRLMVALALVAATVAGGIAVTTSVHVSADFVPSPTGTPTPTRHGHGLM